MSGHIHFLGIGGVSMCGLAALAAAGGAYVTGSDRVENDRTALLRRMGISVTIGQDIAGATGASLVVYTAAIAETDPSLVAARQAGVSCITRAAYLGACMLAYKRRVGVAGVHGKSTVTGMLAAVFAAAGADATVLCGAGLVGDVPYRLGGRELLLFEACEYRDSFLAFSPTVAVLLNLEWEHVDYFHTLAQMRASFAAFAAGAQTVVANGEDANLMEALGDTPRVTYGFREGDYTLRGLDWYHGDTYLGQLALSVLGRHNLQNALAAATTAHTMGFAVPHILAGLAAFSGVDRRLSYRGRLCGARVYDDYAHHPTEVAASIAAARDSTSGRLICAFQSHTYSRTAAFRNALCHHLKAADKVFLLPIYAAREAPIPGVSAEALAADIPNARVCADAHALARCLTAEAREGDLVLIMGAGDIDRTLAYLPLSR